MVRRRRACAALASLPPEAFVGGIFEQRGSGASLSNLKVHRDQGSRPRLFSWQYVGQYDTYDVPSVTKCGTTGFGWRVGLG